MKKNLAFLILFALSFNVSTAQSLEEKIAVETCNCLSKFTRLTEKDYSDCMGSSFANEFLKEKDPKIKASISTVEGLRKLMATVYALLPKTCDAIKEVKKDEKKNLSYSHSKNEKAKEYYSSGKEFMNESKFNLAIKSFQRAIKEDKNYVLAYDDMAASYRQLEDYDSAINYYKKSLEIFPEGDFALVNIGVEIL
jgi:tetratricopeptide (TPR) repeat protein